MFEFIGCSIYEDLKQCKKMINSLKENEFVDVFADVNNKRILPVKFNRNEDRPACYYDYQHRFEMIYCFNCGKIDIKTLKKYLLNGIMQNISWAGQANQVDRSKLLLDFSRHIIAAKQNKKRSN